jgi:hypothetical protein
MNDNLNLINTEVRRRELRRQSELWRLGHQSDATRQAPAGPAAASASSTPSTLVIRMARTEDDAALARLAQLDGHRRSDPPLDRSGLLVAEVEGEVLAALPIDGENPIADPFSPTAALLEMLDLRAAQLRYEPPRRGLRAWLSRFLRTPDRRHPACAPATPGNARMLIQRD